MILVPIMLRYQMNSFNRLFKKTNTGVVQYWDIFVYEDPDHSVAYIIRTEYGQLDTPNPQVTHDTIWEGKNVGKKNETTAHGQAIKDAQSKWEKQKKKGYVESIVDAENNVLDELIEGGILPMLAQSFSKHAHKISYPCYTQPKLDGVRCIAILKNGKCTLWSRTRKQITSCPHIVKEIEEKFIDDIVLDGELYNHDFKSNFEHIIHLVRQETPDPQHTDVQYHIYDLINDKKFNRRTTILKNCFTIGNPKYKFLKFVSTEWVENEDSVMEFYNLFKDSGYEGAMLRNSESLYVNKRSYDLQKVKTFESEEYDIVGIQEGSGKLQGHVGSFICCSKEGGQFNVKLKGELSYLKELWENEKLWYNKKLTVQYQGLTNYKVPRFPVGIAIRDYE